MTFRDIVGPFPTPEAFVAQRNPLMLLNTIGRRSRAGRSARELFRERRDRQWKSGHRGEATRSGDRRESVVTQRASFTAIAGYSVRSGRQAEHLLVTPCSSSTPRGRGVA